MTTPRSNFHTPALRQKRKHSSGRVGRSTPGDSGRVPLQSRGRPANDIGNRGWALRPVFPPVLASGAGEGRRYAGDVARSVLQQIHNPQNRECGCDPDCWCSRTSLGRLVKVVVPCHPDRAAPQERRRGRLEAGSRPRPVAALLAAVADVWGGADPCTVRVFRGEVTHFDALVNGVDGQLPRDPGMTRRCFRIRHGGEPRCRPRAQRASG